MYCAIIASDHEQSGESNHDSPSWPWLANGFQTRRSTPVDHRFAPRTWTRRRGAAGSQLSAARLHHIAAQHSRHPSAIPREHPSGSYYMLHCNENNGNTCALAPRRCIDIDTNYKLSYSTVQCHEYHCHDTYCQCHNVIVHDIVSLLKLSSQTVLTYNAMTSYYNNHSSLVQ